MRISLSHRRAPGAAAPPRVRTDWLEILTRSPSPQTRLRSRAGLSLPRQTELGYNRGRRKLNPGSIHGAVWECCIRRWEAENRSAAAFRPHPPGARPPPVRSGVTGLNAAAPGLGFKEHLPGGKRFIPAPVSG